MSQSPVYAAVEVLYAGRHHLPGDVIRSLDCILFCASAGAYGQAEGFEHDPAEYAEHDARECEADDAPDADPPDPWSVEAEQ